MKWPLRILICSLAYLESALAFSPLEQTDFSARELTKLRNKTRDLFFHSWNNYRDHALPADELCPLSCTPNEPDANELNFERNDALGNISITLLDTLDMFPIMGEDDLFRYYTDYVAKHVSFNVSSFVQVFEVTIRAMGGLLSSHLYASVPALGHAIPGYNGHLLEQAYDLGVRLLPAFDSPTGIPYARVNLGTGAVSLNGRSDMFQTCSAGAGSLLLEFTLLSRLTGDGRFETLARHAFAQIWSRRSDIGLVGMGIDMSSGRWTEFYTGIGASVDSFYEYALKYGTLFRDADFQSIWASAYATIEKHVSSGWFHHIVSLEGAEFRTSWIDALTAFWAGVQVLSGDILSAVHSHLTYYKLWNTFGGIPDRWEISRSAVGGVLLEWYLLRPEFIESNYYLYLATRDPFYLHVGKVVLEDIENINRVRCGVAATQDVRTGKLSDRMDSFFLSETLKYLYLLFTPLHPLNRDSSNWVFSTEAHPFWSDDKILAVASADNYPSVLDKLRDRYLTGNLHDLNERQLSQRTIDLLRGQVPNGTIVPPSADSGATCQSWREFRSVSHIASSAAFYQLDSEIDFSRPSWLYRRADIESLHGFSRKYVANGAQCYAPELAYSGKNMK